MFHSQDLKKYKRREENSQDEEDSELNNVGSE